MGTRELTGEWYLRRNIFGRYKVMVEVISTTICRHDFTESPEFRRYEKAKEEDFSLLGIRCI